MNKPIIVERYADNGAFSHWALIQEETGELLWSEELEEEMQKVKKLTLAEVSDSKRLKHYDAGYSDGYDDASIGKPKRKDLGVY